MLNCRQFGLAVASVATLPAGAWFGPASAQLTDKYAEQLTNGEFDWFPDRSPAGPILFIVSLPEQLVYVYRNGVRIAASTCSTGKPGHRTPTGVFKILQKDKNHHSSTYNNAPMPNMNRLTWSGIALHAGHLPGYPASHGCVRLPKEFSALLVRHHQGRHDGRHCRRRVPAGGGHPSGHGAWRICGARVQRGRYRDEGDRIFGGP